MIGGFPLDVCWPNRKPGLIVNQMKQKHGARTFRLCAHTVVDGYFSFTGSAGRVGKCPGFVFIRACTSATARSNCGSFP